METYLIWEFGNSFLCALCHPSRTALSATSQFDGNICTKSCCQLDGNLARKRHTNLPKRSRNINQYSRTVPHLMTHTASSECIYKNCAIPAITSAKHVYVTNMIRFECNKDIEEWGQICKRTWFVWGAILYRMVRAKDAFAVLGIELSWRTFR